ncbi:CGNR zinc finger domain-containing protein [Peristeroidobacter agariperforans]|uniref:CGNR zinc finger domain-containing protein n=1 Tax=Peristeroidobacter agariperforans TaxID=268404 RepID=UPI0018E5734C|nr:CGNR zinc finger domain-containing protein [Peristeroidobacter agariperforans]
MARQIYLDSYGDAGVIVSLRLVNELAPSAERHRDIVASILAFDPSSLAAFRRQQIPGFVSLSMRLRGVIHHLLEEDLEAAAGVLNEMLAEHPAHPHLAKEDGRWRLHHHPADAQLVPMYVSICAEALARMIGEGLVDRFGRCEAKGCDILFFDTSKNGTRRFCSTTCQSRTKTAVFRQRQRASGRS